MPRVSGLPCLEEAFSSSGHEAFDRVSSDDMHPPSPITLITREIAISLYTNGRIKRRHFFFSSSDGVSLSSGRGGSGEDE
jgi:hypothetical protein